MTDGNADISTHGKARLTCKSERGFQEVFGQDNPMVAPLVPYSGVVFPNTPTMQVNYAANYATMQPVHSNFTYPFYQSSAFDQFTLTMPITATTNDEARYAMAVNHFLRSTTKMVQRGGDIDFTNSLAGTPPPVLLFSIYGDMMFNKVPVVVNAYSFTYEQEKDMVPVSMTDRGDVSYVPVEWNLVISLMPAYNPATIRREFSTDGYASGAMIFKGYQ